MTQFERLTAKDWDLCTMMVIGMQPMQILPQEIKEVKDGFLIFERTELNNENGAFSLDSSVQLCNIATLDFMIKNKIITNAKKNGRMIVTTL